MLLTFFFQFILTNEIFIIKIKMCELITDFLATLNGFHSILFFFFNHLDNLSC